MIRTQRNAVMRHKNNQNMISQRKINFSAHQSSKQNLYHVDKRNPTSLTSARNTYQLSKINNCTINEETVLRQQNRQVSRSKSIKSQRNIKKYMQPAVSTSLTAAPNLNTTLPINYTCSKFFLSDEQQQNRDKSRQRNTLSNYNYLRQLQNGGCLTSRMSARKDIQIEHKMQSQNIQNMQSQIQCLLKVVNKKRDKQNNKQDKSFKQMREDTEYKQSQEWGRSSTGTTFTEKLKSYPFSNLGTSAIQNEKNDRFDQEIYKDLNDKYHKLKKISELNSKPLEEDTYIQASQRFMDRRKSQFKYSEVNQNQSKLLNKTKQINGSKNNTSKACSQKINYLNDKTKDRQKQWIDLPQLNSSYIEVIDKQIQKIKGKIMDSQRVTRMMQSKYLNVKSSRNSEENQLENSIHLSVNANSKIETPKTPRLLPQFCFPKTFNKIDIPNQQDRQQVHQVVQKQMMQIKQTQSKQIVQKSQMRNQQQNKNNELKQMYNQMLIKLAITLSRQVDLDIQMRQWRQYAKFALEIYDKKRQQSEQTDPKRVLWEGVIKNLAQQGYHYTLFEIKDLLTVTSCQTNPLSKIQNCPSLEKIIHKLSYLFLDSQAFWHSQVMGSINKKQSQMCGFSLQVLDLNKKGFIAIEDVVCFVNLYAGKFYRNRDFVMMFRRILLSQGKNIEGKKIQYSDIQPILYDCF